MRITLYTLGCKLNHCETETLAAGLAAEGFDVSLGNTGEEPPGGGQAASDAVFINTCTVTGKAEQKARRLIREALKKTSCVVVFGCYAELNRADIERLDSSGSLTVVSGSGREHLAAAAKKICHAAAAKKMSHSAAAKKNCYIAAARKICHDAAEGGLSNRPRAFRSRPFIKIQDGCDNACSYCRVRLARGKSVSVPPDVILSELAGYERSGYAETVLTGVNIEQYSAGKGFSSLLEYLLENTRSIALRLSSLSPAAFTEDFFEVFARARIRPHIHISVQAGSERILQAMGRGYTAAEVLAVTRRLREVRDDPFIACDIIAGFPGEDEEAFGETLSLCENARFTWIHAFPYSPRPGTAANGMKNRTPERETVKRVAALTALARKENRAYSERWIARGAPLAAVPLSGPRQPAENIDTAAENVAGAAENGGNAAENNGNAAENVACAAAGGWAEPAFTFLTENYIKVNIAAENLVPAAENVAPAAGGMALNGGLRCRPERIDGAGNVWGVLV